MSRDAGRCTEWVRSRRQYEMRLALMNGREDVSESMKAALRARIIELDDLIHCSRQPGRHIDP